jgi:hypothetical protein
MKTLMTTWPTAWVTRRVIKCGCIAQITQKGSRPNFKPLGMSRKVTRINVVTYRIQWNPRTNTIVVHLDRLAPYQGVTRDEQPYGQSCWRTALWDPTHEEGTLDDVKTRRNLDPSMTLTCHSRDNCGRHRHIPTEEKKWWYACRLLGMNSLKEGAMSHDRII